MRLIALTYALLLILTSTVVAQEQLWTSFKYNDGISYIPSFTGYHGGSLSLTHRKTYLDIEGAPNTTILSGHQAFHQNKIGIGTVVVNERINAFNNVNLSIPVSYFLDLNKDYALSFGLSPEFIHFSLNQSKITNEIIDQDPLILSYENSTALDFSFSSIILHKNFQAGVSLQRIKAHSSSTLPSNLILYGNYAIPLADDYDRIEITQMVYKNNINQWNSLTYAYYTFLESIIAGIGFKTNNGILASIGYNYNNRLVLGYNFESNSLSDFNLGSVHELAIRYNLNTRYYDQRRFSIFSKPLEGMKLP